MIDADLIHANLIRNGRAMVHVVEGLEVLKGNSGSWRETLLLNLTLNLYRHRLQSALGSLPRDVQDEILKASETGTFKE